MRNEVEKKKGVRKKTKGRRQKIGYRIQGREEAKEEEGANDK